MKKTKLAFFVLPLLFSLFFIISFSQTANAQSCAGVVCDSPPTPCHAKFGTCDSATGSCNYNISPGKTCDSGDSCYPGKCDAAGACQSTIDVCKGIVPCGRQANNPNTSWDDTQPCGFCHIIMLVNQAMNFLLQIASLVALLSLILSGFLFIISAGDQEKRNLAKNALKWAIVGFLIMFLAWLIIDFFLSAWGYLDPLGGKWNVICD